MERELTHFEAAELLGAYALDAVDSDERDAVERHLHECPRCRAELADHRTVASFMASGGGPAPEGLWDRIAGSLEEAPPELRLAPVVPIAGRRSVSARLGAAVAAVAAAVIALLGVEVVHQGHQIDRLARPALDSGQDLVAAAAIRAMTDSAALRYNLHQTDGRVPAQAVVLPNGDGFLVSYFMPKLPSDRTYQLWALVGDQKISAGVLGPSPRYVPFHYTGAPVKG